MDIVVKSCRYCPFLDVTHSDGTRRITSWECSRGAFGQTANPPDKETIPGQCPLLKEDITIKARKV